MRYVVTSDELLIAGSESGMVPQDEFKILEKGRLGPGEMLAVDMDAPQLFKDRELKDMLADTHDYAQWTTRTVELDSLIKQDTPHEQRFSPDELRRRQFSVGWSVEDLEMILHPMCEDGKEAVGSMGDDAPLAVLSDTYRGMHHYFRQNFSQVTNPPIDSLRERNVMTIRTRLGNLGNILRIARAERDAVAAVADRAQRRVRGDAQVHGRHRRPHRLHLRGQPQRWEGRARRHAAGLRSHLPRG